MTTIAVQLVGAAGAWVHNADDDDEQMFRNQSLLVDRTWWNAQPADFKGLFRLPDEVSELEERLDELGALGSLATDDELATAAGSLNTRVGALEALDVGDRLTVIEGLDIASRLTALEASGGGGGGSEAYGVTLNGTGNITGTTANQWTPIDAAKLAWSPPIDCEIGDTLVCLISGQWYHNSNTQIRPDFAIDRPDSGDTQISDPAGRGLIYIQGGTRQSITVIGVFTCTEAGEHRVRPIWKVDPTAANAILANSNVADGADNTSITFTVIKGLAVA